MNHIESKIKNNNVYNAYIYKNTKINILVN